MIKKIYRLNENEIKKVLKFKKPFFSYGLIGNYIKNKSDFSRFSIFLSSKNTKTAVCRNFFRRFFYNTCSKYINKGNFDIVFVPKKGKVFDKNNRECISSFENDIKFILNKTFNNI